MRKCGGTDAKSKNCAICAMVVEGDTFSCSKTAEKWTLTWNETFDCASKNVVFLVTCKACPSRPQYVGKTESELRKRVNDFKSQTGHLARGRTTKGSEAVVPHFALFHDGVLNQTTAEVQVSARRCE